MDKLLREGKTLGDVKGVGEAGICRTPVSGTGSDTTFFDFFNISPPQWEILGSADYYLKRKG